MLASLLVVANRLLYVQEDPRIDTVVEMLPGYQLRRLWISGLSTVCRRAGSGASSARQMHRQFA